MQPDGNQHTTVQAGTANGGLHLLDADTRRRRNCVRLLYQILGILVNKEIMQIPRHINNTALPA
jgi:hypothetical protein